MVSSYEYLKLHSIVWSYEWSRWCTEWFQQCRWSSNSILLLAVGRIMDRRPKDTWAVRFAVGAYLIDRKYFEPLEMWSSELSLSPLITHVFLWVVPMVPTEWNWFKWIPSCLLSISVALDYEHESSLRKWEIRSWSQLLQFKSPSNTGNCSILLIFCFAKCLRLKQDCDARDSMVHQSSYCNNVVSV